MLNSNTWNLNNPLLLPQANSPILTGANFNHSSLQNTFFEVVNFKGAFGNYDWTSGWANFDPQNTNY
jgi:hypothetical protein